jgi:magnesium chelatase accessory protein
VRDLPALRPRLLLLVGEGDLAIPPSDAARIAALVPASTIVRWPRLGHLAHEENPALATAAIVDFARELGLL